jgi:tetratricopeptide (TPR) repeat protein
LEIQKELTKTNPAVTQFQGALAITYNSIGNVLDQLGKPAESLTASEKALAIRQKLAEDNTTVTPFQADLAQSYVNLGVLRSRRGRSVDALEAFQKGLAVCQKLVDDHPAVLGYQAQLANLYNELGRFVANEGRLAEALAYLERGERLFQKVLDSHPLQGDLYQFGFGESHFFRGRAQWKAGRPAEAAAELQRAVAVWSQSKIQDAAMRFERSWALAILAQLGGDAKSGVSSAEAAAFADQAVAALADAIRAGWAAPDELKESDFDALRSRDDFKKLLAELESRNKAKPKD